MRAATHDPCLASTIDLRAIELPKVPWTSLILLALGAIVVALVASEAHGRRGTSNRAAPPSPAPPTAVALPTVEEIPVELAEPAKDWVDAPLYDLNRRELAVFSLPLDGELDDAQADAIARFMRCRRTGRQRRMHPGVLAMLADLARQYPGHVIEITSAYRAKPRTTSRNRHRMGRAIDLKVRGVRLRDVRDYLWTTYTDEVGIGYYPHSQFLHMDSRPNHKAIAWTQRRKNAPLRYNPWWSIKLRRQATKQAVAQLTLVPGQPPSTSGRAPSPTQPPAAARAPSASASRHPTSAARAATPLGRSSSMPRR